METAQLEMNTGGRVQFVKDTEVRILELDGTVSKTVYLVDQERSDRKGFVALKERDGTRLVRVHHRRVLPLSVEGKAVVIESGDQYWALCPEHGQITAVEAGEETATCPQCSKIFPLHWLGVRPMAEATATPAEETATAEKPAKAPKAPKAEKAPKPPKAEKPPKEPKPAPVAKEPAVVDLAALAKLPNCELWTKKNVKFDHERIDVQAHVLLFVGDGARKLCFNTYNGTLGKKPGAELPAEAFCTGTPVAGAKKETPWFAVPDLDKARAKLTKEGYEKA